ncbi:MAG: hypothetical protein Kow00105_17500 [Phycisphaeraceae bacterium]
MRAMIYLILTVVIVVLGSALFYTKLQDIRASRAATAPPDKVTVHFNVTVPPETPRYQKLYLSERV